MKIVSVKFHNLNSLKGTHEIRFDKSPFIENGLFAITGPTGAGKTTILDAITVALYGQVSRHPRSVEEIMTRHTGESWSEVEFETGGSTYRAKWSLSRSRGKADGNLQTPKRELAQKNELSEWEILGGNKIAEVQSKIIELSCLDYDQFMRSVMLSQGDFTRFLKAGENERAELLEKITDTAIYSELSAFVYQEARNKKLELESIQLRLGDVTLLTEEEQDALHTELATISAREQKEKEEKDRLSTQLQWLKNIDEKRQQVSELETRLSGYRQEYDNSKPVFDRLERHKKAVVYQPELNSIKEAKARIEEYVRVINDTGQRISELEELLGKVAEGKANAEQQKKLAQKEWDETTPVIDHVLRLDEKISTEGKNIAEQKKETGEIEAELKKETNKLVDKKKEKSDVANRIGKLSDWLDAYKDDRQLPAAIATLNSLINSLQQVYEEGKKWKADAESAVQQSDEKSRQLQSVEAEIGVLGNEIETGKKAHIDLVARQSSLLGNTSIEQLEHEEKTLPLLVKNYEELLALSEKHGVFVKEIETLEREENEDTKRLAEGNENLRMLSEAEVQARKELKDVQHIVALEQQIKNYEQDRATLVEGEPCSLCGSIHHPYVTEHRQSHFTEHQLRLQQQETLVEELDSKVRAKQQEMGILEGNLKSRRTKLATTQAAKSDVLTRYHIVSGSLPQTLQIDDTNQIAIQIEAGKNKLIEAETILRDSKAIAAQLAEIEKRNTIRERRSIELDGIKNNLEQQIKNLHDTAGKANEELENLKSRKDDYTIQAQQLVSTYGVEFDYRERVAITNRLQASYSEYIANEEDLRKSQTMLVKLEGELKSGENTITALSHRLYTDQEKINTRLEELAILQKERKDIFGDRSPVEERARMSATLNECNQRFLESTDRYNRVESDLKIKLSQKQQSEKDKSREEASAAQKESILTSRILASGFSSISYLESQLMTEPDAEQAQEKERTLNQNIHTATEGLRTAQTQLQQEQAKGLTEKQAEEITVLLAACDERTRAINQQIGNITNQLRSDHEQRKKHEELSAEVALKRKDCERWEKLSALIGSKEGDKFRKFAQGLTLQRLTELANRHLAKLNDRYALQKSEERDLELKIIDTYQADIARPVNTLSGGESFLVSLALALGLSDMAGRKAQINSLFIDEGFGTLDAEALDIAITTLENLQANGKMIAIISHVEALKERISTQVQVRKLPGGYSSFKIVSGQVVFA